MESKLYKIKNQTLRTLSLADEYILLAHLIYITLPFNIYYFQEAYLWCLFIDKRICFFRQENIRTRGRVQAVCIYENMRFEHFKKVCVTYNIFIYHRNVWHLMQVFNMIYKILRDDTNHQAQHTLLFCEACLSLIVPVYISAAP